MRSPCLALVFALAIAVTAPAWATNEDHYMFVPDRMQQCVELLVEAIVRGANTDTPHRRAKSIAELFPMGAAALMVTEAQAMTNEQQRGIELTAAFGVFEESGVLAQAIADEFEARGLRTDAEYHAVVSAFDTHYPTAKAQMHFADAVAQRLLLRVHRTWYHHVIDRIQGATTKVSKARLAALDAALTSSRSSGFAELHLYILHRFIRKEAAFQQSVRLARRGWLGRTFRWRGLPPTISPNILPDPSGTDVDQGLPAFVIALKKAAPATRAYFVLHNLYVLPPSYLHEVLGLPLESWLEGVVRHRLQQMGQAPLAAAAEPLREENQD